MPATIVVETGLGVTGANSYISLADAETYMEERLYATTWDAATDDNKNRALIQSARIIDARVDFKGVRLDDQQAMEWPREGVSYQGHDWPEGQIPAEVRYAQVELANSLLSEDRTVDPDGKGIKSVSVGKGAVELEYDHASDRETLPDIVADMLKKWTVSTGAGKGTVAIVRV